MTSDKMREIAREYESQWSTDESSADVDKYDFTFEKYDLTNLKNDLRKFLESEYKLWESQFGEEDATERLTYFLEEYPFDEMAQKNDPLVIIEKDGKGYVWDGTHRTSGLLENNIFDAWAIVGRPKSDISEGRGQRGGSKLNLKQALEIRDNQYRSRDGQRDYQPEEIDARIFELQANKGEREQKEFEKMMEEAPDDYFDRHVAASTKKKPMNKLEELEVKQQEVNYLYQLADLMEKLNYVGISVEDLKTMKEELQGLGLLDENEEVAEAQLVDEFITAMLSSEEPEEKTKKKK